ncbi:MAG: tetratricopeptide repeat protein [Xenococcus sp. (in: cyanobacteria)]
MANTVGIPNNLPPPPSIFIGRAKEVAELKHALSDSDIQAAIISGVPGIGKTALASFVINQPDVRSKFPGGIVWVDCKTENSFPKILQTIANTLDIESASSSVGVLRETVISKLRSQATLIVLDEYELVAENDEILSFIGRIPKQAKVLLTSRELIRIPNRNINIHLEGFTESEAEELLFEKLETEQLSKVDSANLKKINYLTGGSLVILSACNTGITDSSSISEVLRKLEDEPDILYFSSHGKLEGEPEILSFSGHGESPLKLKDILKQSINALSEEERKFIEALSIFVYPVEGKVIATVAGLDNWNSYSRNLTKKSLVGIVGKKYTLHALVRTYLRSRISPDSLSVLQQRMVDYFLNFVEKYQYDFELLEEEWLNIQYTIEVAYNKESWQKFLKLILALGQFLIRRDYQDNFQKWLNQALKISKKLDEDSTYHSLLRYSGILYQQRGNLNAAIDAYQKILQHVSKFDDPRARAVALENLGLAYKSFGNYNATLKYFQEALEICHQNKDLPGETYQLKNLGSAYFDLGNFQLAEDYFKQALEIVRNLNYQDIEADLLNNLGTTYSNRIRGERADNLEKAEGYFKQALEIARNLNYQDIEADLLNNLGTTYINRIRGERADNLEKAKNYFKQALKLARQLGNPSSEASVITNLGSVYSNRIRGERSENLERAIASYNSAFEVYTRETFPNEWASVQNNLASAYSNRIKGDRTENLERAIASYNSALEVYTRETFPNEWASVKYNLGLTYHSNSTKEDRSDNLEIAIVSYNSALEVYTHENFPVCWAAIQNNLGNAYNQRRGGDRMENLKKVIYNYELALKVYTKKSFPRDWLKVTTNLSKAHAEMGDWSQAKKIAISILQTFQGAVYDAESIEALIPWYQEFGELAIKNNDVEFATRIFAEIAYCYKLQKEELPNSVCTKLNQLRKLLGEEHFCIIWAEVQCILTPRIAKSLNDARQLMQIDQFDEAFKKFSNALEMISETKNKQELYKQQATILFLRGFCLRKQGFWETALEDQEKSFKLFEKVRDFFNTARVLLETGHLYEVMNNYEPARIYYMDAYRHSRRAKDKIGMACASEHLGRLEYRVQMFPQAVKNLEEAKKLYILMGERAKANAIESDLEDAKASLVYQANTRR